MKLCRMRSGLAFGLTPARPRDVCAGAGSGRGEVLTCCGRAVVGDREWLGPRQVGGRVRLRVMRGVSGAGNGDRPGGREQTGE